MVGRVEMGYKVFSGWEGVRRVGMRSEVGSLEGIKGVRWLGGRG